MLSAKPIVYLDLDRTLFATTGAAAIIWVELTRYYSVDVSVEAERQSDFYVTTEPDGYYYDFAAHLQACGIDPDEAAERLAASEIADDRLLLPGAGELVARLRQAGYTVEILTFGQQWYQQLKVRLCPTLATLAVHVTLQSKALFLADKGTCVMVDDKDIASELPPRVAFYRVQIEDRAQAGAGVYTRLGDVADAILNT